MRILSIGNSFSQDAHRYLHSVAKASGKTIDCINLYIGGCSLETHYRNMLSGVREYYLEFNGQSTGFRVSLEEALLSGHFDAVTLQQASGLSKSYQTFTPYLSFLAAFARKCAPGAKLIIHQTWAYEDGSDYLERAVGSKNTKDMLTPVIESYEKARQEIAADGIIPSGELIYELFARGVKKIYRDSFHASLGISRYALALLWAKTLGGADIHENAFSDFDEPVSDREKATAIDAVEFVLSKNKI